MSRPRSGSFFTPLSVVTEGLVVVVVGTQGIVVVVPVELVVSVPVVGLLSVLVLGSEPPVLVAGESVEPPVVPDPPFVEPPVLLPESDPDELLGAGLLVGAGLGDGLEPVLPPEPELLSPEPAGAGLDSGLGLGLGTGEGLGLGLGLGLGSGVVTVGLAYSWVGTAADVSVKPICSIRLWYVGDSRMGLTSWMMALPARMLAVVMRALLM
jgi:hypothetical protein